MYSTRYFASSAAFVVLCILPYKSIVMEYNTYARYERLSDGDGSQTKQIYSIKRLLRYIYRQ